MPTPGSLYQKMPGSGVRTSEDPIMMARAVLLLASEPAAKINGRVTYSQQILKDMRKINRRPGAVWISLVLGIFRRNRRANKVWSSGRPELTFIVP